MVKDGITLVVCSNPKCRRGYPDREMHYMKRDRNFRRPYCPDCWKKLMVMIYCEDCVNFEDAGCKLSLSIADTNNGCPHYEETKGAED